MCLVDPSFNQDLLPELEQFVFCGEKLFSTTVEKLMERFPRAEVVNTYGPTESTVMVTWMPLTRELLEKYPDNLPVGVIKPGTTVLIDGPESGEIIIYGNTVAKGYYENPEMNAKHFFEVDGDRAYRTGTWDISKEIYYSAKDESISKSNYMATVLSWKISTITY